MKYNIKDNDKLWTAAGTPEKICDGINEEKSDWNSEVLTVGLREGLIIDLFDIKMIGLADFPKL